MREDGPTAKRARRRVAAVAGALVVMASTGLSPTRAATRCSQPGQVVEHGQWTAIQPPAFPDSSTVHAVTAYAVDPGNADRLLVTNGTTVMRSTDGGCTWQAVLTVTTSPAVVDAVPTIAGVSGPAYEARANELVAAGGDRVHLSVTVQRDGVDVPAVLSSADGGATWSGGSGLPGSGRPADLAAGPGAAYVTIVEDRTTVFATVDGGRSWARRGAVPVGLDRLVADEGAASTVWAWGRTGLARSSDGAASFATVAGIGPVTALDVAHGRGGPAALTVFGKDGRVDVSVDDGRTFRPLAALGGATAAAHTDDGSLVAVAGAGTGVHRLRAGRPRWEAITPEGVAGLADAQTTRTRPATVYVRTDAGLERTVLSGDVLGGAGGTHRLPPGPPFLTPPARDVRLQPGGRAVVAQNLNVPRRLGNPGPVDVWFLVDTTSSMHPLLAALRAGMGEITRTLAADAVDARFGIADFKDVPVPDFGSPYDYPYRRVRDLGPPDAALLAALDALEASGGGDVPESHLSALLLTASGPTTPGAPPTTPPLLPDDPLATGPVDAGPLAPPTTIVSTQGASFRADAQKLVVLGTDAPFHRSDLDPTYPGPSFRATVDALAARGIKVAGLGMQLDPGAADPMPDLRAMALSTGTRAATGIDCDGDGDIDVPADAPVVCRLSVGPDANLAAAVLGALRSVDVVDSITLEAESGGGVVRALTPTSFGPFSLRADHVLPFRVTYGCEIDQAGQRFPVRLRAEVRGRPIFTASLAVLCGDVASDPAPAPRPGRGNPPVQRPQPNPQVQPTPQVQIQPVSQVVQTPAVHAQPGVATSPQERQQPELAGAAVRFDATTSGERDNDSAPAWAWTMAAGLLTAAAAAAARRAANAPTPARSGGRP